MRILDVWVDNVSQEETWQKIREFLTDGGQHYIVTPNAEFLVRAQKDEDFRKILNNADLALPDGAGLIWASRFLGKPLKERVSGVDLVEWFKQSKIKLVEARIFLLGGRGGVAKKIADKWPEVVGFSEETEGKALFEQIEQCRPNILFVALGAPKQEKWIAQNLLKIPSVKLAVGVGGAFDMLSGKLRRAPRFMQKMWLEWLWRLILQPQRLPRIFNALIKFPWLILKEKKSRIS